MPALGDPPLASAGTETRTAHGAPAPVAYVPQPLEQLPATGRPGGRRAEETRRCVLRAGAVPNAAGSAYLEQGRTKILATVYGPRQAQGRDQQVDGMIQVDLNFAPFSSRWVGKQENEKRITLYSSLLQSALESVVLLDRYSKLAFDVSVLILEDDGAVLTAALSAVSLALADAKVEMRDLVAGATVHLAAGAAAAAGNASNADAGKLLLDCEGSEERSLKEGSAVLHLGFCPTRGSVCLLHSAGALPGQPFEQMVLLAKETADALGAEMRRCLEDRVGRRAAKRARLASAAEADAQVPAEAGEEVVAIS